MAQDREAISQDHRVLPMETPSPHNTVRCIQHHGSRGFRKAFRVLLRELLIGNENIVDSRVEIAETLLPETFPSAGFHCADQNTEFHPESVQLPSRLP